MVAVAPQAMTTRTTTTTQTATLPRYQQHQVIGKARSAHSPPPAASSSPVAPLSPSPDVIWSSAAAETSCAEVELHLSESASSSSSSSHPRTPPTSPPTSASSSAASASLSPSSLAPTVPPTPPMSDSPSSSPMAPPFFSGKMAGKLPHSASRPNTPTLPPLSSSPPLPAYGAAVATDATSMHQSPQLRSPHETRVVGGVGKDAETDHHFKAVRVTLLSLSGIRVRPRNVPPIAPIVQTGEIQESKESEGGNANKSGMAMKERAGDNGSGVGGGDEKMDAIVREAVKIEKDSARATEQLTSGLGSNMGGGAASSSISSSSLGAASPPPPAPSITSADVGNKTNRASGNSTAGINEASSSGAVSKSGNLGNGNDNAGILKDVTLSKSDSDSSSGPILPGPVGRSKSFPFAFPNLGINLSFATFSPKIDGDYRQKKMKENGREESGLGVGVGWGSPRVTSTPLDNKGNHATLARSPLLDNGSGRGGGGGGGTGAGEKEEASKSISTRLLRAFSSISPSSMSVAGPMEAAAAAASGRKNNKEVKEEVERRKSQLMEGSKNKEEEEMVSTTVTAAVSFGGSVHPSSMNVLSSMICPTSGRIMVGSRPIEVRSDRSGRCIRCSGELPLSNGKGTISEHESKRGASSSSSSSQLIQGSRCLSAVWGEEEEYESPAPEREADGSVVGGGGSNSAAEDGVGAIGVEAALPHLTAALPHRPESRRSAGMGEGEDCYAIGSDDVDVDVGISDGNDDDDGGTNECRQMAPPGVPLLTILSADGGEQDDDDDNDNDEEEEAEAIKEASDARKSPVNRTADHGTLGEPACAPPSPPPFSRLSSHHNNHTHYHHRLPAYPPSGIPGPPSLPDILELHVTLLVQQDVESDVDGDCGGVLLSGNGAPQHCPLPEPEHGIAHLVLFRDGLDEYRSSPGKVVELPVRKRKKVWRGAEWRAHQPPRAIEAGGPAFASDGSQSSGGCASGGGGGGGFGGKGQGGATIRVRDGGSAAVGGGSHLMRTTSGGNGASVDANGFPQSPRPKREVEPRGPVVELDEGATVRILVEVFDCLSPPPPPPPANPGGTSAAPLWLSSRRLSADDLSSAVPMPMPGTPQRMYACAPPAGSIGRFRSDSCSMLGPAAAGGTETAAQTNTSSLVLNVGNASTKHWRPDGTVELLQNSGHLGDSLILPILGLTSLPAVSAAAAGVGGGGDGNDGDDKDSGHAALMDDGSAAARMAAESRELCARAEEGDRKSVLAAAGGQERAAGVRLGGAAAERAVKGDDDDPRADPDGGGGMGDAVAHLARKSPRAFCVAFTDVTDIFQTLARAVNHCDDGMEYVQDGDDDSLATTIDTVYSNLIY